MGIGEGEKVCAGGLWTFGPGKAPELLTQRLSGAEVRTEKFEVLLTQRRINAPDELIESSPLLSAASRFIDLHFIW